MQDEKEVNPKQHTTSILELLYLIRAKNKGEMSFAEWLEYASSWAAEVIAEYEAGQADAAPPLPPTQAAQGCDEGGCRNCQ